MAPAHQFRHISTHDLTRRSTVLKLIQFDPDTFQLTTSRGGRRMVREDGEQERCISTHDLTRRSTHENFEYEYVRLYFNSRPHEEVDDYVEEDSTDPSISTHDLTRRSTTCLLLRSF